MKTSVVIAAIAAVRKLADHGSEATPTDLGKMMADARHHAMLLEMEHAKDKIFEASLRNAMGFPDSFEPNQACFLETVEKLAQLYQGPMESAVTLADRLYDGGNEHAANAVLRLFGEVTDPETGRKFAEIINERVELAA